MMVRDWVSVENPHSVASTVHSLLDVATDDFMLLGLFLERAQQIPQLLFA